MKRILSIFILLAIAFSCEEDIETFNAAIDEVDVKFTPIAGGAIMHYTLPSDPNITAINLRYTDVQGKEILRSNTVFADSMIIHGFDEAMGSVMAKLSLVNNNNIESASREVTFSTNESGPWAFFNGIVVGPYWGGFSVKYNAPENTRGLAHIFYEGVNPLTNKTDDILVETFVIEDGEHIKNFTLEQRNSTNTVKVVTEDFRGYTVKSDVWKDVNTYEVEKVSKDNFEFSPHKGTFYNSSRYALSPDYLFDGDSKGRETFLNRGVQNNSNTFYTFLGDAPSNGFLEMLCDFGDNPQTPAYVDIHVMLFVRTFQDFLFGGAIENKIPSTVAVYVSNDKSDDESWIEIGRHSDPADQLYTERWSRRAPGTGNIENEIRDVEQLDAAEPCFLRVKLNASESKWQYMKIVIEETFDTVGNADKENTNGLVTFNELEIFVRKY